MFITRRKINGERTRSKSFRAFFRLVLWSIVFLFSSLSLFLSVFFFRFIVVHGLVCKKSHLFYLYVPAMK